MDKLIHIHNIPRKPFDIQCRRLRETGRQPVRDRLKTRKTFHQPVWNANVFDADARKPPADQKKKKKNAVQ